MFETVELNDEGLAKADEIGKIYTMLLAVTEAAIPAGRTRSIITTKLQEAILFTRVGLSEQVGFKKDV